MTESRTKKPITYATATCHPCRNHRPTLDPIPNQITDNTAPFSYTVHASDVDVPAQNLRFSLDAGAPTNMQIDTVSGPLTWTVDMY